MTAVSKALPATVNVQKFTLNSKQQKNPSMDEHLQAWDISATLAEKMLAKWLKNKSTHFMSYEFHKVHRFYTKKRLGFEGFGQIKFHKAASLLVPQGTQLYTCNIYICIYSISMFHVKACDALTLSLLAVFSISWSDQMHAPRILQW